VSWEVVFSRYALKDAKKLTSAGLNLDSSVSRFQQVRKAAASRSAASFSVAPRGSC